jgi:hypothetical protein
MRRCLALVLAALAPGVAARLLDARRCGDDEEGPCAVRQMTE